MVVFNGADRIHNKIGFISSVTINFSSPSLIHNPSIILYLLSNEENNSHMFRVDDEAILLDIHIQQGIQTIALKEPIECCRDQFVALAFGRDSGNPASVKNRNEYFFNLDHFSSVKCEGSRQTNYLY